MNKELGERMKEIYEETICKVRAEGKIERDFWTVTGVRQGCPLSAKLFTIH